MASLTDRALNGMFWISWSKMGRGILQVGVLALLARLVSPSEFGVVNAALVVVEFSTIFTHLGLGKALVQHPALRPEHVVTVVWSSLGLGALLGTSVWLAAPAMAAFFRIAQLEPVLRVLAWSFPLRGLAAAAESVLFRELRFKWLATRELLSYVLGYGLVGVTLAWLGYGFWALVCAHFAQAVLNTVLLLAAAPPPLRVSPSMAALRELAYFGGGYTLARIANYASDQGDTVVVGRALGAAALGLYGRACQLVAVPAALLGDVLDTVLFPTLARTQHDVERLARAYRRGVALVALAMLPTSVVFFILAPEIVGVVLGPRWTGAVLPVRLFSIGLMLRTSCRMADALARATGAVYRRAWRQWVFAGLVAGGAAVGQQWGVAGAATGVVLAYAANFGLMSQLSVQIARMRWSEFAAAHVPAASLAAACAVLACVTRWLLEPLHVPPLVLLVAISALLAIVFTLTARRHAELVLGADGLWLWDQVQARIPALRFFLVPTTPAAAGGAGSPHTP